MHQHQPDLVEDILRERPRLTALLDEAARDGIYMQTEISDRFGPDPGACREAWWRQAGLARQYAGIVRAEDLQDPPHQIPALHDECLGYLRITERGDMHLLGRLLSDDWAPGADESTGAALTARIHAATGPDGGPMIMPTAPGVIRAGRVIAYARGRLEVVPRDLRLAATATVTEDVWKVMDAERDALLREIYELRGLAPAHVAYARTTALFPRALVSEGSEPWYRDTMVWPAVTVPAFDWGQPGGLCRRADTNWLVDEVVRLTELRVRRVDDYQEAVPIAELCEGLHPLTWDTLFTRALKHHRVRTTRRSAGADSAHDHVSDVEEDADNQPIAPVVWPKTTRRIRGGNPLGQGEAEEQLRSLEARAQQPPREVYEDIREGLGERIQVDGQDAMLDRLSLLTLLHIRARTSPRVLLLGRPGVGKSHTLRALALVAGVPAYAVDATEISETAYRGQNTWELMQAVVSNAHGSPALASRSMILLDEIDKVRVEPGDDAQSASKRRGQQTAFLTLLGGGSPMSYDPGAGGSREQIVTDRMMVVCAGAFGGLVYAGAAPSTQELVRYGILPEIADRIQHRLVMRPRGVAATVEMLRAADGGVADIAAIYADLDLRLVVAEETYRYAARLAVEHDVSPRESIGWIRQAAERLLLDALRDGGERTEWVLTPDDLRR